MKHTSFLQVALLAVLVVAAASCGMPMGAQGDYYEGAPARRNIYFDDSYYGNPNAVIVQRDPFTGRYYQVNPGGFYGSQAPYYNRRYNKNRYYNNRSYNTGRNNNYRTYPQAQQRQQAPAQREQVNQNHDQARDAILGKKRN